MNPPDAPEPQAKREESGPKHRTGLVTLLFTDMVGSTALKQQLGDRAGAAFFDKHHRIVREILARFPQGQEMETAGDSFLILFGTPSDAVQFALLLQAGLRKLKEESAVAVGDRIGIHVGEVVIKDNPTSAKPKDLYGIQIDTCSRVMSLAQAGQVLMTRSVFDSARQVLKGEDIAGFEELNPEQKAAPLVWLNHGPYLLKGLEEPVEICEVREASQGALSAPTSSDKAQRQVRADEEQVLGWRPAIGQLVPNTRWLLEKKLGEGGFGEVWLGRHQTMKERRVFKFCFRADRVRSLKREMTLFRVLKERVGEHPSIVALRDVSFDEPPFYVVMDHVEGKDLRTWSEERGGVGSVPLETKLEIVAQIADALQVAHDAGVIHRDVKPGNILISDLRFAISDFSETNLSLRSKTQNLKLLAKLTDFGIGQVVSEEALKGMTKSGFTQTMMSDSSSSQTGSQMYMAPELLAGKPASTRSDIYSLGVVLYQLLLGDFTRPLTTDWTENIAGPLLRDDLKLCFAGNPQDRFAGAGQLAKSLRALPQRETALAAQQALVAARERAAYRRGLMRAAAVAAVIVAAMASLVFYARQQARLTEQNRAKTEVALDETRRTLSQGDFVQAGSFLAAGHSDKAVAYLVRSLKNNPTNHAAVVKLAATLTWKNFALPLTPPLKHHSQIKHAVFSADGRKLLTGALDQTARVWDVETGQIEVEIKQDGPVIAVAFSPDGWKIATGLPDGGVQVWDAVSGKPLAPPIDHQGPVFAIAFNPDGTRLITGGKVKTWIRDAADGRVLNELLHLGSVFALSFNSDGAKIVTGAEDRMVRLWQTSTGTQIGEPLPLDGWVTAVAFSLDGTKMAAGSRYGSVRVWDTASFEQLAAFKEDLEIVSVGFAPDGNRLLTSTAEGAIRIWDVAAQHVLADLNGNLFSPDGTKVATLSPDGTAQVWNATQGAAMSELLENNGFVRSIAFSPDGTRIVTATVRGILRFWDVAKGQRLFDDLEYPQPFMSLDFSADGKTLIAGSGFGPIHMLDAFSGKEMSLPLMRDGAGWTHSVQMSPDRTQIASASYSTVSLWNAQTGKLLFGPWEHEPTSRPILRFTPDGSKLVTVAKDAVRLWDTQTGKLVNEPWRLGVAVATLPFAVEMSQMRIPATLSLDGKTVAVLVEGGSARVWDLTSRKSRGEPISIGSAVTWLALSPDGSLLASGYTSGAVRVWDVASGALMVDLQAHDGSIESLTFSPDGRRLASGSVDETCRIWDIQPALSEMNPESLRLAEVVAGVRLNQKGLLERVSYDESQAFRRQVQAKPTQDEFSRWAGWLLADRASRPLSPRSQHTLAQYVQQRIERNTVVSLREALRLAPSNPTAMSRLGLRLMEGTGAGRVTEADWWTSRALRLAPDSDEASRARGDFLFRAGRLAEALHTINQTLERGFNDPLSLALRGRILFTQGEWENAARDFARAANLGVHDFEIHQLEWECWHRSRTPLALRPQLVEAGASATFQIAEKASPALRYQWRRNGVPIAGATNVTLEISRATAADVGSYSVAVSDLADRVTVSQAAPLTSDPSVSTVTGQWDFKQGDLSATVGYDLDYLDGPQGETARQAQFGTTTSLGLSDIDGRPGLVMKFPAATPSMGYVMRHGAGANGGGTKVNQYTLIMDVLWPDPRQPGNNPHRVNFFSFIQIDDLNNRNDADLCMTFFDGKRGGIGIASSYGGATNVIAGHWHRVVFAVDMAARVPVISKYIDGVKHADQINMPAGSYGLSKGPTDIAGKDGRFSLHPAALLFADENKETMTGYVSSIQIHDVKLTDGQIHALGGPSVEGIPLTMRKQK